MSEVKHTSGPWAQSHRKVSDDAYWTQVYRADDPTYEIASVHWAPRRLDGGVIASDREANARVIAAAPEGLEANIFALDVLEAVNRAHPGSEVVAEAIRRLRSAISAAEGRDHGKGEG